MKQAQDIHYKFITNCLVEVSRYFVTLTIHIQNSTFFENIHRRAKLCTLEAAHQCAALTLYWRWNSNSWQSLAMVWRPESNVYGECFQCGKRREWFQGDAFWSCNPCHSPQLSPRWIPTSAPHSTLNHLEQRTVKRMPAAKTGIAEQTGQCGMQDIVTQGDR